MTCDRCGATFVTARPTLARFCSAICRARAGHDKARSDGRADAREAARRRTVSERASHQQCGYCGEAFSALRKKKYCSKSCAMRAARHRHAPDYRRRRRALFRTIEVETFLAVEIFERDRWVCQICRHRVDPTLKHPDPRSASLDHVIPLSEAGTSHTRANVRLAHLSCNASRNNRGGGEQLALIG